MSNGDFESGKQNVFSPISTATYKTSFYQGNPDKASDHAGKYCMELSMKKSGSGNRSVKRKMYINRNDVYRISAKVYTSDAINLAITGYSSDGKRGNLKDSKGRVWGYSTKTLKGPTKGWQTVETTIGPPGSNAQYKFLPTALLISMTLRFSGAKGAIYVDDISLEKVNK